MRWLAPTSATMCMAKIQRSIGLQELAAEMLGKEAALFVASGTMGNLVALLAHCGRGDEVILGDEFAYLPLRARWCLCAGRHDLPHDRDQVPTARLPPRRSHGRFVTMQAMPIKPFTGAICLENTHNRCGGMVLPLAYLSQVKALADAAAIVPLHLDGARLANAAVALGVPMQTIAAARDIRPT